MNIPFLKKWLKNPLQMGTIKPSSKALTELMLSQVPENAEIIVEFGAGTGPITVALDQKFPHSQIFSFELDEELAEKVRQIAPHVKVYSKNVIEAPQVLPSDVIGKVDVILSSLPLLNIPEKVNGQILNTAFQILRPHAAFVQFTYLPFLPPVRIYKELNLWAQFIGVEFNNLPPGFVWSFRRISDAQSQKK